MIISYLLLLLLLLFSELKKKRERDQNYPAPHFSFQQECAKVMNAFDKLAKQKTEGYAIAETLTAMGHPQRPLRHSRCRCTRSAILFQDLVEDLPC